MNVDNFGEYFITVARNLNKHYENKKYSALYQTMLGELNELSYEGQIEALSHMIREVVNKNRSLTENLCLVVLNLFDTKIKGTGIEDAIRHQIVERILSLQSSDKPKIFEKLEALCFQGSTKIKVACKNEKEKEKSSGQSEELVKRFCTGLVAWSEMFKCGDSGVSRDIINTLLDDLNVTLEDQCAILQEAKNRMNKGYIQRELKRYLLSLQKFVKKKELENAPKASLKKKKFTLKGHIVGKDIDFAYCRPFIYGHLLFLPAKNGTVHCLDLQGREYHKPYKLTGKNPLFIAKEDCTIPGMTCEKIAHPCLRKQMIFAYFNNDLICPSKVLFEYPYLVRAYDTSLEIDNVKEGEHFSFEEKHNGTVTSLIFVGLHRLLSGSTDKTVKFWNLRKKRYKGTIDCWRPVKDIAIFDTMIFSLTDNALMNCDPEDRSAFPMDIDAHRAEVFRSRNDGFIFGLNNGNLRYIKIDKKIQEPITIKTGIEGSIMKLTCLEDIVIAQSEKDCAMVHLPLK